MALTSAQDAIPMRWSTPNVVSPAIKALPQKASHRSPTSSVFETSSSVMPKKIGIEASLVNSRSLRTCPPLVI